MLNFVEIDTKLSDSGQAHLGQPAPPWLVALLGDLVNVCHFISERYLTRYFPIFVFFRSPVIWPSLQLYIFLNKLRNSGFSYGFFHTPLALPSGASPSFNPLYSTSLHSCIYLWSVIPTGTCLPTEALLAGLHLCSPLNTEVRSQNPHLRGKMQFVVLALTSLSVKFFQSHSFTCKFHFLYFRHFTTK